MDLNDSLIPLMISPWCLVGGWRRGKPYMIIWDLWRWQIHGKFTMPHAYCATVALGGTIYMIGGVRWYTALQQGQEIWCYEKRWCEVAPMCHRKCYTSAAVLDGSIYAISGYNGWIVLWNFLVLCIDWMPLVLCLYLIVHAKFLVQIQLDLT